ncbi:MAG: NADH-quinone oxidoreductase subunit NuoH [bacterium]|nr:NADH-quinone oxidoreductase subunit NuoH [bacterium]
MENVLSASLISNAVQMLLVTLAMLAFVNLVALVLIYAERKVCAHFQCRLGPMRVGWHGVLQPVADAVKLLFKESPIPAGADKLLFIAAPFIPLSATFAVLAFIPWPVPVEIANLNTGVIFIAAISSLGVLGLLLAGWSSNNKYSLLGAIRTGAQLISYELTAALAVMVIVMLSGTLNLQEVVLSQEHGWWIWRGHLPAFVAFILFTIAATAECNRTPFDLAEGESELTAGFHTEYAGMKFAVFFLAEFLNMFVFSALSATFFFGGWLPFNIAGLDTLNQLMAIIPGAVWFLGKTSLLIFLMMWFRWTFPRLRIDQMMQLEWKVLLPIGLVNIAVAAIVAVNNCYFFP